MITDSCWHVIAVALETGAESRHPDHDASVHVQISVRICEAQRQGKDMEEMDRSWDTGWCVCVYQGSSSM